MELAIVKFFADWINDTFDYLNRILSPINLSVSPEKSIIMTDPNNRQRLIKNGIQDVCLNATFLGLPVRSTPTGMHVDGKALLKKMTDKTYKLNWNTCLLKILPSKIFKIILTSYIYSIMITYAPTLIPLLTTNQNFSYELEKIANFYTYKKYGIKPRDGLTLCQSLLGIQPLNHGILMTGFKHFFPDFSIFTTSYHFSHLLPKLSTIRSDKIWWGINPCSKGNADTIYQDKWIEYARQRDTFNWLIPKWKVFNTFKRIDIKVRFIAGRYNFLTKNSPCSCGSNIADNLHWLNHCPKYEHLRNQIKLKDRNNLIVCYTHYIQAAPHKLLKSPFYNLDVSDCLAFPNYHGLCQRNTSNWIKHEIFIIRKYEKVRRDEMGVFDNAGCYPGWFDETETRMLALASVRAK
uniref:Uncharacterized protein n=1 Tax=Tetranychus urticae TaxID=32264 RepID=T1L669_TETUR